MSRPCTMEEFLTVQGRYATEAGVLPVGLLPGYEKSSAICPDQRPVRRTEMGARFSLDADSSLLAAMRD